MPCFLIGGLADGYRDSILRMLEQVKAPLRALIGPWNHSFPNNADFGPRIEWREDAVRWWDYWLKGRDTGVLEDPKLVIFMRHWFPPDPNLESVPGEWRAENQWPPANRTNSVLYLQPNQSLDGRVSESTIHQLKYIPSIGVEAGFWWGELLADQRPVDAFSLVYDSEPLRQDLAIMGRPHAFLKASADAPLADWFARLSDVAPDGQVTQITGAGLSGAQRESMTDPKPLERDRFYDLDVEMHLTTWVFPKGHRIRLSVSNALWPMVLSTPYTMTTALQMGGNNGSRLQLPVVPVHGQAPGHISPPQPEEYRPDIQSIGFPWPGEWLVTRDEGRQKTTVLWKGRAEEKYPWGEETDLEKMTYEIEDQHPELNVIHGEAETTLKLKGRVLVWSGHLSFTSDAKTFFYKYTRELRKDGTLLKTKTWEETIPRDFQ
ncbi:MAG TPA: CocE/NonD family hydrolase C-terminal non-catalytic domain-containing protein [Terriglobales bacterium]|nr:CocE/NonD family hydrolase C-terminal non-catalytic domain-containing protein [Terriglobales bacterium]